MRNVLRLITAFAVEGRDAVSTVDPYGSKGVFQGCTGLPGYQDQDMVFPAVDTQTSAVFF